MGEMLKKSLDGGINLGFKKAARTGSVVDESYHGKVQPFRAIWGDGGVTVSKMVLYCE